MSVLCRLYSKEKQIEQKRESRAKRNNRMWRTKIKRKHRGGNEKKKAEKKMEILSFKKMMDKC